MTTIPAAAAAKSVCKAPLAIIFYHIKWFDLWADLKGSMCYRGAFLGFLDVKGNALLALSLA